ncbi:MAG: SigE family RNA polymerase sigma factor [Actinomycetota bacterium]
MGSSLRDQQFAEFYAAEASGLARLALFLTGDREKAADLAQEALLRTYRHWNRITYEHRAYARKILINFHRNTLRRLAVEARHRHRFLVEDEPSRTGRVDDAIEVARVLRTLPPARRAVIVLRFYEDMSEAEIAHILDRPISTVKSDIHRALKKLRTLLADEPIKEPT